MDHSKRKNIYIIVFVVTTIIAACVAVYFGIKENERKGDLQIANKDIEEYKAKLEQATVNKGEATTPSTDKKDCEEKVVEKVVTKSTPVGFNKDKCLNKEAGQAYFYSVTETGIINSIKVHNGVVTANFSDEYANQWFDSSVKVPVNTDIVLKGFSGKVIECFIGMTGQAMNGSILLFIMEDGTVEYIPLMKAMTTGKIDSYGKLPGVNSIVKCFNGTVGYTENGEAMGGARDTFLCTNTGDFYSLANIVMKNKLID